MFSHHRKSVSVCVCICLPVWVISVTLKRTEKISWEWHGLSQQKVMTLQAGSRPPWASPAKFQSPCLNKWCYKSVPLSQRPSIGWERAGRGHLCQRPALSHGWNGRSGWQAALNIWGWSITGLLRAFWRDAMPWCVLLTAFAWAWWQSLAWESVVRRREADVSCRL